MDDQKYIRTFEGDVKKAMRGGTPDRVPFLESTPTPTPTSPPPSPVPTPQPVREKIVSLLPKESPSTETLKTYAGDFSERMKETQASTATVLAAEQDSAPRVPQMQPEKVSHSNLIYGIGGGILLIGAVVGAYVAYTQYLGGSAPVIVAPTTTAPIFIDESEQISGTGTVLQQAIIQSATRPIAQGAIRLLYLGAATTSNASVFSELKLPAPGALTRNIDATQSMVGVVNVGGTQSLFFILSVASYGDTFAGMLSWENHMPRDLIALFPPYPAPVVTTSVTTTTTSTSTQKSSTETSTTTTSTTSSVGVSTKSVVVAAFYDTTIANHDVRVYRDTAGRDVLLYGYWNQKTLIVAKNAAAFTEIVRRLATSRAQ